MLSFTFLGTSSGVPTLHRNVSGLALRTILSKKWILIDAGEGTQHRIQQAKLSLRDLAVVCITHVHGDHCYGLLGLLASAGMNARTEPLTLIAPPEIWQWFQLSAQLTDLHLGYDIQFIDSSTLTQPTSVFEGVCIQSYPLHHRVPCHAFAITAERTYKKLNTILLKQFEVPKGKLWGELQQGFNMEWNGQTIYSSDVVIHDTYQCKAVIAGDNDQPELLTQACQGAQVLIHEATFTQAALEKVGKHHMHSSARQIALFAQTLQLPNLILTHFSPRHHDAHGQAELHQEAENYYEGKIFLAQDLDVYGFDREKHLLLVSSPTLADPVSQPIKNQV